jgi:hypothetical protein
LETITANLFSASYNSFRGSLEAFSKDTYWSSQRLPLNCARSIMIPLKEAPKLKNFRLVQGGLFLLPASVFEELLKMDLTGLKVELAFLSTVKEGWEVLIRGMGKMPKPPTKFEIFAPRIKTDLVCFGLPKLDPLTDTAPNATWDKPIEPTDILMEEEKFRLLFGANENMRSYKKTFMTIFRPYNLTIERATETLMQMHLCNRRRYDSWLPPRSTHDMYCPKYYGELVF